MLIFNYTHFCFLEYSITKNNIRFGSQSMLFNYCDLRTSFTRTSFTQSEANEIADILGISFEKESFTLEDFTLGINVELEHGTKNLETNVINYKY
ncbi:MAG: hypothetical protein MR639_15675 [Clostridium sp.]|uniref:hypothetical protein n=1 Tax=Clostridium sp. TaxID=1506 RepID=UPI002A8C2CA0|nr:hypothetical protein [Clostridium sp.]MDY5097328.1 DUF5661 family protein [Clostridium sp.]